MSIKFELYGEQLDFNDDLKKYSFLKKTFDEKCENVISEINKLLNDRNNIEKIVSEGRELIDNYIRELIAKLSLYNIYDKVIEDFSTVNQGYMNILKTTSVYLDFVLEVMKTKDKLSKSELQKAKENAQKHITGLDFGVLSGNLVAHLMYVSQEERALKKQAKEAEVQYNRDSEKIISKIDQETNDILDDMYYNSFIPNFLQSIRQCFFNLFIQYTEELSKCNQLDLKCAEQMNYERSDAILKNVEVVENKKNHSFTQCNFVH